MTKDSKTESVTVRLTAKQAEQLDRLAQTEDRSRGAVVRQAIAVHVESATRAAPVGPVAGHEATR